MFLGKYDGKNWMTCLEVAICHHNSEFFIFVLKKNIRLIFVINYIKKKNVTHTIQ
jgi:hypothetical protein